MTVIQTLLTAMTRNECVGSAEFYRELPEPTIDDTGMRVCRDQDWNDEDILLNSVQLYVL